jgi:GNAT superfamily N-acetyltransferase
MLTPVPADRLATVVTTLEMREGPRPRPLPPSPFRLVRWAQPDGDKYRQLFRRVGARWLWYSRLALDETALRRILDDPRVAVHAAVDRAGIEIGMVELDFRTPGTGLLAYFALVPELTGRGHGDWLMAQALMLAWRPGVTRLVVNTCTLDHPAALGFYRRHGFQPVRRTVEQFPDPRLVGLLPADAAPQIPLLGAVSR